MRRPFLESQKYSSVPYARRLDVFNGHSPKSRQWYRVFRRETVSIKMQEVLFCTSELLHQKFQLYVGRNLREHRNILQSPYELGVVVYK